MDKIAARLGKLPPADFVTYRARTRRVLETQLRPVPGIDRSPAVAVFGNA